MTARRAFTFAALGGTGLGLYGLLVRGALTVDLGIGRTVRPLGPLTWQIAAPRELVFEVISSPYLDRTPRALESKLRVLERGEDMVLAEHFTPVGPLVTTTLETVRFEPPDRVRFRLVRGPVPHVAEQFVLRETEAGTELEYNGELGTDLWALGRWWGGSSHPAGRRQCMARSAWSRPRRSGERPASSGTGPHRKAARPTRPDARRHPARKQKT